MKSWTFYVNVDKLIEGYMSAFENGVYEVDEDELQEINKEFGIYNGVNTNFDEVTGDVEITFSKDDNPKYKFIVFCTGVDFYAHVSDSDYISEFEEFIAFKDGEQMLALESLAREAPGLVGYLDFTDLKF